MWETLIEVLAPVLSPALPYYSRNSGSELADGICLKSRWPLKIIKIDKRNGKGREKNLLVNDQNSNTIHTA